jgi:hypothetical protein
LALPVNSLVEYDGFDRGVEPRTEHKETKGHDENVDDGLDRLQGGRPEFATVQMVVGHGPEDEAVERVECSRHDGQEVSHAWNDTVVNNIRGTVDLLSKDKGNSPETDIDEDPSTPADKAVAVGMPRIAQDSLVDEFTGNIGVEGANDDGGDHDKGKGRFSLPWLE